MKARKRDDETFSEAINAADDDARREVDEIVEHFDG